MYYHTKYKMLLIYVYICHVVHKVHKLNFAKDNFDDNIDEPVNDNDMENYQCECS